MNKNKIIKLLFVFLLITIIFAITSNSVNAEEQPKVGVVKFFTERFQQHMNDNTAWIKNMTNQYLFRPFGIIKNSMGGGVNEVKSWFGGITNIFTNFFEWLKGVPVLGWIVSAFDWFFNKLGPFFQNLVDSLLTYPYIAALLSAISLALAFSHDKERKTGAIIVVIISLISFINIITALVGQNTGEVSKIKQSLIFIYVVNFLYLIPIGFGEIIKGFRSGGKAAENNAENEKAIKDFIKGLWDVIWEIIKTIFSVIKSIIMAVLGNPAVLMQLVMAGMTIAGGLVVVSGLQAGADSFGYAMDKVQEFIDTAVQNTIGRIGDSIQKAVDNWSRNIRLPNWLPGSGGSPPPQQSGPVVISSDTFCGKTFASITVIAANVEAATNQVNALNDLKNTCTASKNQIQDRINKITGEFRKI
jgi:hypothetical protein